MRIQKSHLHDTVSQMQKHPQHTSRIHRTDETRITRQIWRTPNRRDIQQKTDDAVPQHLNQKGPKLADVCMHVRMYVYVTDYLCVLEYEHTPEKWGLGTIWGLFKVPAKMSL